jgi:Na+-transporting methylmalonyl-CoA/oxaloacetate decarboxylase gamma subunit
LIIIAEVIVLLIIVILVVRAIKKHKRKKEEEAAPKEVEPDWINRPASNDEEVKATQTQRTAQSTYSSQNSQGTTKSYTQTSSAQVANTQPAQKKAADTKDTAAADDSDDDKKNANKTYHISKRKEDGKWQIKAEGGAKAIKLFDTQADAIEYAKKVADNQEGRIVIHKEDGSFRRLTYGK